MAAESYDTPGPEDAFDDALADLPPEIAEEELSRLDMADYQHRDQAHGGLPPSDDLHLRDGP